MPEYPHRVVLIDPAGHSTVSSWHYKRQRAHQEAVRQQKKAAHLVVHVESRNSALQWSGLPWR